MAYRRPMDPMARIEDQWILRPVEDPWIIWPTGGPWLQQSVCCHDYFGLVSKNRLLWPLEKHRKRTAVTTSKQLNKTIRKYISKQLTLAYYHYYTYYIHWASKFATSANIGNKAAYYIHWPSKLATSANKRSSKTRA